MYMYMVRQRGAPIWNKQGKVELCGAVGNGTGVQNWRITHQMFHVVKAREVLEN